MLNRNFKKAALITAIAAIGISSAANASIIDKPVFKILGAVVVWGGNAAGTAGEVNDFMIKSGTTDLDLISGNVRPVITGQLTNFAPTASDQLALDGISIDSNSDGVLDASDTLAAFAPTKELGSLQSTQSSSFYVASNTSFTINAVATANPGTDLSEITRTMTVLSSGSAGTIAFGSKSQIPNSANGIAENGTLDKLATVQDVYTANRKTATGKGTIAEQSVQFTNVYQLANDDGLAAEVGSLGAEITYTIAMP